MSEPTIDPTTQVTRNIGLAFDFLDEVLADPAILDAIPDEATLVMMPHGDPALAAANFALAEQEARTGKDVHLRPVGGPAPDAPAWKATEHATAQFKMLTPRWPRQIEDQDIVLAYDRDRDALLIDFFAGRRVAVTLPFGPYVLMRVELATEEVVGYLVPDFLARAVPKMPHLARILAAAEFRPLTPDELGGMEPEADEPDLPRRPDERRHEVTEFIGDLVGATA